MKIQIAILVSIMLLGSSDLLAKGKGKSSLKGRNMQVQKARTKNIRQHGARNLRKAGRASRINNDLGEKNPILMEALERGDLETAFRLAEEKVGINAKNEYGTTPLDVALRNKLPEFAELLIEKGADVNAKTIAGATPLHQASGNNYPSIVLKLIHKGAKLEARDAWGDTPLHDAANQGSADSVRVLIAQGANVNAKRKDGLTPLKYAKIRGYSDTVKALRDGGAGIIGSIKKAISFFRKKEQNLEPKAESINTQSSPIKNSKDNVQKLQNWQGPIVMVYKHDLNIRLIEAAKKGEVEIVEKSIRDGAKVDAKDYRGGTALHWAVWNGHREVVEILTTKKEIDINAKDKKGITPLALAEKQGYKDIAQLLIDRGAKKELGMHILFVPVMVGKTIVLQPIPIPYEK